MRQDQVSLRGSSRVALMWIGTALGALGALVSPASAQAARPVPPGMTRHLRPSIHVDRYGRTLQDVCPEYVAGQRRCFAQRILPMSLAEATAKTKAWVKAHPYRGGGGGSTDPNCQSQGSNGTSTPPTGTMTPTDIRAAYKIPSNLHANGKIVALVELPSTHALADVNAYRTQYSIPTLPPCTNNSSGVPTPNGTACFARVGADGTVNTVSSTDCPGWAGETALDIDMVSAVCPDCSIVLVEAADSSGLDAVNTVAATVVHADTVSNSWGAPEGQLSTADDETPYGSSGVLIFAASGDQGYLDEDDSSNKSGVGANFPASSHFVVAVGGTTLEASAGGSYTESVWNDDALQAGAGAGGSGCSVEWAMPSYQSGSGINFASCSKRASVDVSASAEFTPSGNQGGGIGCYGTDAGGWQPVVGTSAASPLVAAVFTLVGLGGTDNHALIYKNPSAFNDVVAGTNDNDSQCSDLNCKAGTGWDGPTGMGSPNVTALAALAGNPVGSVDMAVPPDLSSSGGTTSSGNTTSGGTTSGTTTSGTTTSGGTTSGGTTSSGGTTGQMSFGSACTQASDCESGICISGSCTTLCGGNARGCGANQHCANTGGFSVCVPGPGPSSGGCAASSSPSTTASHMLLLLAFGILLIRRRQIV